jgi:uncharacterized protein (DUF1684 family)
LESAYLKKMRVKRAIKTICLQLLFVIVLAAVSFSCRSENPIRKVLPPDESIIRERAERDAALKSSDDSPILPKDRDSFHGLVYYPIDSNLRFTVRLNRYYSPDSVRMSTNTSEVRRGLRYGYFEFQAEGKSCRLQVYRLDDTSAGSGGAYLFIPFRDATSGHETYEGGRYIDLQENTSGIYSLDFNRSYNPSCAYNSDFSCPVPPRENMLPIPIRAGEKKYH